METVNRPGILRDNALFRTIWRAGDTLARRGAFEHEFDVDQIPPVCNIGRRLQYGGSGNPVERGPGKIVDYPVYGGSVTWGISGFHAGKRMAVGVAYRGSYSIYGRDGLNSLDQNLMLSASRRLSARMMLSFNTNAGLHTRDFGLLGTSPGVPYDPATAYIPTTDFFDDRTYYSTSQLGLTIQKSARLSFGMSGGCF